MCRRVLPGRVAPGIPADRPRCGARHALSGDGQRRGSADAGAPNAISPVDALKRLLDGNARYAANRPNERDFSAGRAARAQRQHPIAAILGCADSRVAPELAFDQGPGDIFAVRVAGNFVNDGGLANFEYAVQVLGVPLVLVLGHTSCGAVDAAIKALRNKDKLPGHLPDIVRAIKPAVLRAERARRGRDLLSDAIVENVRLNVSRLQTAAPILKRFHDERRIQVIGAMYDLATGRVTLV
ncbi:MAG: carbonic anhydrase [Aromatoleum sp.]|nr:carbonic anhydrase [Aromatoleum sp.]